MQQIIHADNQRSLQEQIQGQMKEGYRLVPGSIQSVRRTYVNRYHSEQYQNQNGELVDYSYWAVMEIE